MKNLKKLRTQKGISQQKLASEIGLTQQSVNKYENHNIEPDIATLIALADYFDTSVDYLIGRVDEEGNNLSVSEGERLISQYKKLDSKEQLCVKTVIETFNSLK
ncbi:MAG: helix-turn-helix transcriptional regulator [Oscillospiraceae bacterium]|nr:helix-turn-helix transcriptional regulator [Oscillospiraceae bacterium]